MIYKVLHIQMFSLCTKTRDTNNCFEFMEEKFLFVPPNSRYESFFEGQFQFSTLKTAKQEGLSAHLYSLLMAGSHWQYFLFRHVIF